VGKGRNSRKDLAELDQLIEEIIVDAYGDDEQLWAFRQAFEDNVRLPCDALVVGEPVSVTKIDYDGNARRGLTATCQRHDGSNYVVAAADVVFPLQSVGGRHVAAYRRWQGLPPLAPQVGAALQRKRQLKASTSDLDLTSPVELVVLSIKERAARCRVLGSERVITLRATALWEMVPGEILLVIPRKQWSYARHPYLSGQVQSSKLDVGALGLVPLTVEALGMWDPEEEYWGEDGEPLAEWAKPIIARGRRPVFSLERDSTRLDAGDPELDPIDESNDRRDAGKVADARAILMKLCEADLRCLDAHAHLGNMEFDYRPEQAIRHYEVGFRIGELSLGSALDGLLPWGFINNRPFLRCMHGFGLCLWRLGRFEEARSVFDRMLWLNPTDNQGVRFLLDDLRCQRRWEDHGED
jgi:hypothetical protein